MQNSHRHRRLSFVDATYADLPRPVHWVLNGISVFLQSGRDSPLSAQRKPLGVVSRRVAGGNGGVTLVTFRADPLRYAPPLRPKA